MKNNFDLKKFLIENKLTPASQLKENELQYFHNGMNANQIINYNDPNITDELEFFGLGSMDGQDFKPGETYNIGGQKFTVQQKGDEFMLVKAGIDEYFSFNDKSPEGQRAKNKPFDVLGRRGQGQITPDNKGAYKNVVGKKGDMGKYYGNVGPKGILPEDLTDPFPRFQGSTMKEFVRWAVPIFKANNVAKEDYVDWLNQIDDDGGVSDYRGATEKELMDVHFGAWYPEYGSGMPTDEPYADKIKKSRY